METGNESKQNNTAKIVGALLVGGLIGVGLGMLFAPDKGSETRKKMAQKGEDLSDTIKNKLNDLIDELKKEVDKNKHTDFTDTKA